MLRHRIKLLLLFAIICCCGQAMGASPWQTVQYRYGEDRIFLNILSSLDGAMKITHVPVDARGNRIGKLKRHTVEMTKGEREIVLSPDVGVGHQIRMVMNRASLDIFANKGTWYLKGAGTQNAENLVETDVTGLAGSDDLVLATGFSVNIGRADAPEAITVGRTLGPDDGFGVPVRKKQRVLAFRAKGSIGPVMISIVERLDAASFRYWDYPLLLDGEMRRYEIPLSKFLARDKAKGSVQSVHAVSLRSLNVVEAGGNVVIDYLSLSRGNPYIAGIAGGNRGVPKVQIRNHRPSNAAELYVRSDAGEISRIPVGKDHFPIPPDSSSVWLCTQGHQLVCDPPDAPRTAYGVPFVTDRPLTVDAFETPLPINRFRLPTTIFAATPEMKRQLTEERMSGALRITFYPTVETDYAGYLTTLPKGMGDDYKSLVVTLRGSLPPNFLLMGVKDQADREARIPFISYWSGEETAANPLFDIKDMNPEQDVDSEGFRTVYFPIDAFRTVFYNVFEGHAELKDISGISVTMNYGGANIFHEIELRQVMMSHKRVPIVITAFDNEMYGINSLGGVNFAEEKGTGSFDVRFNAKGFYGKGLSVEISLPGEDAYGLVAFGFGKLDVSDYTTLSFTVRGTYGGEDAAVYLNDGACRTSVPISQFTKISKMWRRVKIPLNVFEKDGVDLSHLTQLILAWEGRRLSHQIIYFDNFVIE